MNATRFFLAALVCFLPFQACARDLVVFAASSLKEPLDQIAADFGDVVVSYGGSGALARQVSLGAPVDVIVLAHPRWMDVLDEAGSLAERGDLAGNALVLIASEPMTLALDANDMTAALGRGRMAVGLVAAVPAGIYAKAALEHLDIWDDVSGRLAQVDNVRAALTLVARKEAPLGIVYATDARVSDRVHVAATFPASSHEAIRYEFGIVTSSDHPKAAEFAAILTQDAAQSALANAGFLPLKAPE